MKKNKAFTLIELLVSISIFFILVLITYVPYNFYMNKVKVKNTIKEISQSLYEARNMAINGISENSNKSIGLYLSLEEPSVIKFFSYPYSFTGSQIENTLDDNIKLVKSYDLIEGIELKSINGKDNFLFYFNAISGDGDYFYWNSLGKQDFSGDEIEIKFSYKNAEESSPLFGKLKYFTNTNIVDY